MAQERFEDKQLAKKDEAKIKGEAVEEKTNPHEQAKNAVKADEKAAPAKAETPKTAKKAEKESKSAKDEKPALKVVLERKYTVNLTEAYAKPKYKRTDRAISLLRDFCLRHMKGKDVKVDVELNNAIRQSVRPAKKVQIVLQKDERGTVTARLAAAG
ncbi:60S ribosomal protein L31 [Candidatus Micrarchaeota archaeon]|nr:60S ribosomal protein L31 [Candidatus Micrarchaeota archaeon]